MWPQLWMVQWCSALALGDVCVLVPAVSVSKLTQTRSTRFMTIRSPRRCASPTTNADPARIEHPGLHQSIDAPRSNEPGHVGSPQPAAVFLQRL